MWGLLCRGCGVEGLQCIEVAACGNCIVWGGVKKELLWQSARVVVLKHFGRSQKMLICVDYFSDELYTYYYFRAEMPQFFKHVQEKFWKIHFSPTTPKKQQGRSP